MNRLESKVAIVSGAGGGIGSAICRRLALEGASIVCVDINENTLNETVHSINSNDGKSIALVRDVSEEQTAEIAVQLATEKLGGLDILVNNAVYDLPLAPLTEISLEDWRRTMDVNLNSAFLMSKHCIPKMDEYGGGSIIHIASQLGRTARPGRPWYCAQKAALINLAKAMALDHAAQNIRVNSLSPGPVETNRYLSNFPSSSEAQKTSNTLLDRLGKPDEIAAGVAFLASEDASFMTGSDLLIDGGYTVP
ncbi:MAG: SDR family oxidoreductase [Alphaproteobacteria bacterium]|nr:SDR family oxidoreductase [Alphaproteobacteria bacterium]